MFAFDVSLCGISTLGPMEKCSAHSPLSLPSAEPCLSPSCEFKLLPFLNPQRLIQFKINANVLNLGFWYLWVFFLIRKECMAVKLLSKREGGQNYNPASFIWKTEEIFWKGWELRLEKYFGKYTIKISRSTLKENS